MPYAQCAESPTTETPFADLARIGDDGEPPVRDCLQQAAQYRTDPAAPPRLPTRSRERRVSAAAAQAAAHSPSANDGHSEASVPGEPRDGASEGAGFTAEQEQWLRQVFERYDASGTMDGELSIDELGALLRDIGVDFTIPELERWVQASDDGSAHSRLDLPRFMNLMLDLRKRAHAAGAAALENYFNGIEKRFDQKTSLDALLAIARKSSTIPPESPARWALDMLVVLVTFFHAVVVPLRLAGNGTWPELRPFEWVMAAAGLAEVASCFVTAQVRGGWVIEERSVVPKLYLRSWFPLDLLSVVPCDLVAAALGAPDLNVASLQALRLLRVFKIPSLFQISRRGFLEANSIWFKVSFLPIFMLVWWMLVLVHWLVVAFEVIFKDSDNGNLLKNEPYLTSLYLTVETLTTVGYGDLTVQTSEQKSYATFLFVLGAVLNGYVVSRLTQLLMQADLSQDHTLVLQRTLAVLDQFSVPSDMQREVLSFQYHCLSNSPSATFREVTESLPESMRVHISIFVRIHIVNRVPHFASASPECQVALAQALTEVVLPAGQAICHEGEKGHEMYFIMHGVASVHSSSGTHYAVLRRGSFFGHVALLQEGSSRTASVTAISYCDMLRLRRTDFSVIRARFAEFNEAVEDEARRIAGPHDDQQPTEGQSRGRAPTLTNSCPDPAPDLSEMSAARTPMPGSPMLSVEHPSGSKLNVDRNPLVTDRRESTDGMGLGDRWSITKRDSASLAATPTAGRHSVATTAAASPSAQLTQGWFGGPPRHKASRNKSSIKAITKWFGRAGGANNAIRQDSRQTMLSVAAAQAVAGPGLHSPGRGPEAGGRRGTETVEHLAASWRNHPAAHSFFGSVHWAQSEYSLLAIKSDHTEESVGKLSRTIAAGRRGTHVNNSEESEVSQDLKDLQGLLPHTRQAPRGMRVGHQVSRGSVASSVGSVADAAESPRGMSICSQSASVRAPPRRAAPGWTQSLINVLGRLSGDVQRLQRDVTETKDAVNRIESGWIAGGFSIADASGHGSVMPRRRRSLSEGDGRRMSQQSMARSSRRKSSGSADPDGRRKQSELGASIMSAITVTSQQVPAREGSRLSLSVGDAQLRPGPRRPPVGGAAHSFQSNRPMVGRSGPLQRLPQSPPSPHSEASHRQEQIMAMRELERLTDPR
eukprot:TRINITY_DN70362_c0_g1_i1.p1 TRINITY_DN70362_c0_g1~~TRINITY_DN70362_c0_g1_i1.p1  ORF type:complete len:1190 (+),score=267.74 TRINITY_DN70362_c0_g1_i1:92-3571(+)